jgi:hypothetical protein
MENLLVVQENFSETVTRYLTREMLAGKDVRKTMERIMGYWVLNALKVTRKAAKEDIRNHWMAPYTKKGTRPPRTRKARSKMAHEMEETQALVVVRFINYKGIGRTATFAELKKLARTFVARRVFSAGIHRAGYIPALRRLRQAAGERPPKYKNEPGTEPQFTETPDTLALSVTNFAKVIAEIAGEAFTYGGVELQGKLAAYLTEDIIKAMNRSGLNAK